MDEFMTESWDQDIHTGSSAVEFYQPGPWLWPSGEIRTRRRPAVSKHMPADQWNHIQQVMQVWQQAQTTAAGRRAWQAVEQVAAWTQPDV